MTSGEAFALLRSRAHEAEELRDEIARLRKEAKERPAAASGPRSSTSAETSPAMSR